ncbi:hypothetical protein WHR41_04141 [Cladosporium halotolerans]|uniref:tRNA (guanine(10)-N(2))-methyltransferase n=1 Tax=Cladosporium halotolerans TaxID=1052096 RepID=A0AB34KPK5_9PEZI
MEYLIRFVQQHETFRKPEVEALAELLKIKFRWVSYSDDTPFAIIDFEDTENPTKAARDLVSRSILVSKMYELWGRGTDFDSLHADIRNRTEHIWPDYQASTFRFEFDSYHGTHPNDEKWRLIESFSYMKFTGRIVMSRPENQFIVFEDYKLDAPKPHNVFFGREVAEGGRKAMNKYNVKKRHYIATTSMDAELSLVTANMALSAPGTIAYDPFMGTGSFPVSCAHFGAAVFGSDLDGRSIRGKKGRNVASNFKQYGTSDLYLGGVTADLTNSPICSGRFLDAIVCDPPYGVREGLKVLGHVKEKLQQEVILSNGVPAHLQSDYVPPKKPYSFVRMLDDILDFSAIRLVDGGRLCMWMPVAGAKEDPEATPEGLEEPAKEEPEAEEYAIPQHPALALVAESKQHFNKWSRRLITYRRLQDSEISQEALTAYGMQRLELQASNQTGETTRANDLNDFRKKYFEGFKNP